MSHCTGSVSWNSDRLGEGDPLGRPVSPTPVVRGRGLGGDGDEPGGEGGAGVPAQRLGLRQLHRGQPVGGVPLEVQVGGRLVDQVVDLLHEVRLRFGVAEHPEALEHLQAELVRGGDGRLVDLAERGRHPPPAPLALRRVHRADERGHAVAVRHVPRGQGGQQRHEPLADPAAELGRRHPAEGDQQQLAQRPVGLRHVPRGQRREGEGLARAGARLEHGRPARQRAANVERRVRHLSHHPR
jgi:hypothetical protein